MLQHERALNEWGMRVVVVTFENAPVARAYVADTKIGWPVVIDRNRTLYHHYGMHHGRLWNIWGPSTWWAYAKEFSRGRRPRYSGADTRQLGGDVLVDPAGVVRLHHIGSAPPTDLRLPRSLKRDGATRDVGHARIRHEISYSFS